MILQATGQTPCQGAPTRSDIVIPPYPGAVLAQWSAGGSGMLPGVTLLSTDPPEQVIAFYRKFTEGEAGWKYESGLGIFYRGDSLTDALALTAPSVRISDTTGLTDAYVLIDPAFRSQVKARIEIHYRRGQPEAAAPPKSSARS